MGMHLVKMLREKQVELHVVLIMVCGGIQGQQGWAELFKDGLNLTPG